jgi:hypothetical protein
MSLKHLFIPVAHGGYQNAARGKLLQQRWGHLPGRCREQNPIKGPSIRPSLKAIPKARRNVAKLQLGPMAPSTG